MLVLIAEINTKRRTQREDQQSVTFGIEGSTTVVGERGIRIFTSTLAHSLFTCSGKLPMHSIKDVVYQF